jgi:hypothetical protein
MTDEKNKTFKCHWKDGKKIGEGEVVFKGKIKKAMWDEAGKMTWLDEAPSEAASKEPTK